jgi:hypothetical protein
MASPLEDFFGEPLRASPVVSGDGITGLIQQIVDTDHVTEASHWGT